MQYIDLGQQRPKKSNKARKIVKWGALTVLLGIVVYAAYVLYWPTATLIRQILKQPSSVFSLISNPKGQLKSEDGRTNFLLIGIDKRANIPYTYTTTNGVVHKNGFLTDTIIVASIDKKTKKVAMISIPRDLWVQVPSSAGYPAHSSKINAVYAYGDSINYSGGGAALLKNQVESILGISIQYYGRIDFEGFRQAIDDLGGVDITVDKTFDDYEYPVEGQESANCHNGTFSCRYEHLHFDAGLAHMDGETALSFVRSRHGTNGEGSDFARAKRQQKVLMAAKDKALKLTNLFDPIKLNNLFKDFNQSIETDMDVSSIIALYNLGKEINVGSLNTLVIDNSNYLIVPPADQYGGAYVLIPKSGSWTDIQKAVDQVLN